MQCAAFVAGALAGGAARRALIVAPKTLLAHWCGRCSYKGRGEEGSCSCVRHECLSSSCHVLPAPRHPPHREKELAACGLRAQTHRFFGDREAERSAALRRLTSRSGGVMLTTYGMVLHNADALARGSGALADGAVF
jgi:hypothetical protein